MSLTKALRDTCFCVDLKSDTKSGAIEEMIDMLVAADKITDKQAALSCVLDRERKMPTGMQHGVAIPHGKTTTVDGLLTVFALKKAGLDFGAQDGQPSRIFVMTISSTNRTGPHMEYLAEISKLLSNPTIRQKILEANSTEEMIKLLTTDELT